MKRNPARLGTVLDGFCGIGGISLGCEMADLNVIGGFDHDVTALKTFRSLFPNAKLFWGDFLKIKTSDLLKELTLRRGDVDYLVGGPPCQPFSVYNRQRSEKDHRASLVGRYLELADKLKPRWILMENVPGIISIGNYRFLEKILRTLRSFGYNVDYRVLNAINFGVPQRRNRVFILASRDNDDAERVLHRLGQCRGDGLTLQDAIGDLPVSPADPALYKTRPFNVFQRLMRRGAKQSVTQHVGKNLASINLRRAAYIPAGGNWREIPFNLLPRGMRRANPSDHTTRYGRLRYDAPAFTLLTKCDPHWGCYLHPVSDRVLTVREAARLQSVPDMVNLEGDLVAQYRHIGNAVPPLVVKKLIEELGNQ